MKRKKINLDDMEIAQSCSTDWESMTGDEKIRFCVECNKDVYNFSAMTKRQAELLLQKTGGQICARITRDIDGAVITAGSPVGLNLVNLRASKFASAVVTAALSLSSTVAAKPSLTVDSKVSNLTSQKTKEKESDQENDGKNQLSSSAAIKGTLFDIQKAVIAGANIKLSNETTKEVFTTISGEDGIYKIESLSYGSYKVEIFSPGFSLFKADKLEIRTNQEMVLDVTLQVGVMGEVVQGGPIITDITGKIDPSIIPARLLRLFEPFKDTPNQKKKN
jgi:hypothetical protein